MTTLTQARLKELLHYDPETGVFTWKARPWLTGKASAWNVKWAGGEAGYINGHLNYRMIAVDGSLNYGHRLAWLYMSGSWPSDEIDHLDGNGANNRWNNLREATHSQNMSNKACRADSITGIKGVTFHKSRAHYCRPWQARIRIGRKNKSLGYFETAEQAGLAYQTAAKSLHGEFARAA